MSFIEYFPVAMAVVALGLRFWLGPELIDSDAARGESDVQGQVSGQTHELRLIS